MEKISVVTEALVLIVEERLCLRCGSTSRTPSGLYIRVRNGKGKVIYKRIDEIPVRSFLETATRTIGTSVNACECCFPAADERQLQLFPSCFGARFIQIDPAVVCEPEHKPDAIELAKRKRKNKPAKPKKVFSLEEF